MVIQNGELIPTYVKDIKVPEQRKKAYVDWYTNTTGFPDRSTSIIRTHLQDSLHSSIANTGVPIIFAGCDYNCSLGEGVNDALPGSDVDELFFLTQRTLTEDERNRFVNELMKRRNPMLVRLNSYAMPSYVFVPIADFDKFKNHTLDEQTEHIPIVMRRLMQEITHGTTLINTSPGHVQELKDSPLGKSLPADEQRSDDSKHRMRRLLREVFSELQESGDIDSLYVLVQSQLAHALRRSEILEPIDFKVGGSDSTILEQLFSKGLYYKNTEEKGTQFYRPHWTTRALE